MMKKIVAMLVSMSLAFTAMAVVHPQTEVEAKTKLVEPTNKSHCALCNMVVYRKNHAMGAYSAQAFTKKGKRLFFDDAGCMIIYESKRKETLKKYIRDYSTKKWLSVNKAYYVKGNMTTPMDYGYAYFSTKKAAKNYVKSHKGAKLSSYAALKKTAKKRAS